MKLSDICNILVVPHDLVSELTQKLQRVSVKFNGAFSRTLEYARYPGILIIGLASLSLYPLRAIGRAIQGKPDFY